MIDKLKIVCAISALPVAISNLMSYLYHSYMAVCGMIVCGLAIVLFVWLERRTANAHSDSPAGTNPFRVFVVVFSVLFVLSAGVMVYGLSTREIHEEIQMEVFNSTDEETVLRRNVQQHENAYNLQTLGKYYLLKGGDDFTYLAYAQSCFLKAALKYADPIAYITLAKMEESGWDSDEVDYSKVLDYYIQAFYCLGSIGWDMLKDDFLRLQEQHNLQIPDSVLSDIEKNMRLSELDVLPKSEYEDIDYMRSVYDGTTPITIKYVRFFVDGTSDETCYESMPTAGQCSSSAVIKGMDLVKTIVANMELLELYKREHNNMENMMMELAYGSLLKPVWEALEKEIKSQTLIL